MLGAIVGDIIGSVYEFSNIKTTEFPLFLKTSCFTDDTVMTVALADAILNDSDYADIMKVYYRRFPNEGYGTSFKRWAAGLVQGPYNSMGNGSAMRISPTGWAYNSLDEVLRHAEIFSSVTHNHPEGIKGAQATAASIFMSRTGATKEEIRTYVAHSFGYDLSRTCDEIRPGYKFDVTCQGSVPEAIIAFLESTDFETAIRLAVSLGGDSDTIACITGSIAEAYYGGVPTAIAATALSRLDNNLLHVVDTFISTYRS